MATERRFLTQYSPQHCFSLASVFTPAFIAFIKLSICISVHVIRVQYSDINLVQFSLFHYFFKHTYKIHHSVDGCLSFPILSRLAGLMGLTRHYRLIPEHTAYWCKACSHLWCRWECLCMPVNHPGRFLRLLHVSLCVFLLACELVWIQNECWYRRCCIYLLSYLDLLLLNPYF